MRISRTTVSIGLFIIVSASFMRQFADFCEARVGKSGLVILIGLILAGWGLAFLVYTIRKNPGWGRTAVVVLILIGGLTFAWQMRIPVERIHILEYGLLGWLAGRDLIRRPEKLKGAILAFLFLAIIGISDEVFQAILPYRYFDLRDIGFNVLGGGWGIVLYLLGIRDSPLRGQSLCRGGDNPFNR